MTKGIFDGLKIKENYPFVKELERAIREERKVLLRYKTPERQKTYKVCPLKIVFFDGFWYLLAHVPDRDSKLKFRLEKILELEALDEYFDRPKDLKSLLDESVNIWFSDRRDKKVALRIDKEAAHFFKERKYFPLQKITKENKDGSLILETRVAHYMEVVPTITHWIPCITVLSPAEFKKGIEDTVEGYLEKIRGNKSK